MIKNDSGRSLAFRFLRIMSVVLIAGTLVLSTVIAVISDERGNILTSRYASINYQSPRFTAVLSALSRDTELQEIIDAIKKQESVMEYSIPVMIDIKPIGEVTVGMSGYRIDRQIIMTILFVIAVNLSVALVLGIVIYVTSKRMLLAPIEELVRAISSLAEGDLSTRVNVETSGEIKVLVDSFNGMLRNLEHVTVSKEYVDNIIVSMTDTLIVISPDHKIVLANAAALRLLGYEERDLIGNPIEMIVDDGQTNSGKLVDEILAKGFVGNIETTYKTKNGGRVSVLFSGSAMSGKKRTRGIVCVARDITERRRAEEALRKSEKFTRNVLDSVDEGFIVVDKDFRIITANKAYCTQVGKRSEDVIGGHCYEISHRVSRPCHEEGEDCAVRNVFATGEPCGAIHRHLGAQGAVLYVETKAFPLKDDSGAIISVIETVNNISEKHLLEEERLKRQKLEAIGILAGGIAHDFNNLLQGVFGYISMVRLTIDQKEKSLGMLEQVENALKLAVNLTTQLLTFSKGGQPAKRRMQLQPVIENSVKFALSGSRVEYRMVLDEGLWGGEVDEGQISQVIQNIVLNADQAMPAGGTIMVAARNVVSPKKGLPQLLKNGKYVEISVRDSGSGISEQHLQKIFDPYFTTKEKGSGLGLATSYSIIRNHGGLIDVASEPGKGTAVSVYLPALEVERKAAADSLAARVGHMGKVLLMDDEEIVRNIGGELIRAIGHSVEMTEDGEAALEKYRTAGEAGVPFDIVILDLTIRGGLGGRETIARLLALDPAVRAVVSSGYSDDAVMSEYQKYGFKARLKKPYKFEELRDTLDALLIS